MIAFGGEKQSISTIARSRASDVSSLVEIAIMCSEKTSLFGISSRVA